MNKSRDKYFISKKEWDDDLMLSSYRIMSAFFDNFIGES